MLTFTTRWPAGYTLAEPEDFPGVPNYGEVIPGILYRSGLQTPAGLQRLREAGITTLVSLLSRQENHVPAAPAYGFRYLWLPTPDHQALGDVDTRTWLSLVADPQNWPILVSCHAGSGRTGYAVALVRWAFDAMPFPLIRKEARRFRVPRIALALRIFGWLDRAQKHEFEGFKRFRAAGYLRVTLPAERVEGLGELPEPRSHSDPA